MEAQERTLGEEHPRTLITVNNLSWLRLDLARTTAKEGFARCVAGWADPTDWKHHWARLGLVLCDALETGDFTPAEDVLADLTALLGEDHDRVGKGRDKIVMVRKLWEAQA